VHEIEVFLLKDKPKSKPYIRVEPNLIGVHSGDTVFWHLHSLIPGVKWVEIEFKSKPAKATQFFESREEDEYTPRRYTELHWGHGHMLGTAPELGKQGTARAKYFVRGYKRKPNPAKPQAPFVELDPDIIICDP
jgi:hypothetical protein